ncbi:glucans biosynthesis glucosyltransferase MdoH [Methylocapsa palsarum]|uniref:Glucans biosynthesis glucosyltransferase H n=1 Tax=Methylocapsa palsarum TaxID=1612308 RepID=A0A1I4BSJ9_9HYPH|nr:glucans biosynthesis glucosyltransferase MdoH [Methylocapsa palsarum]SFK71774.1 membrane glycosyltransferase [Methylocapsa palsarum]
MDALTHPAQDPPAVTHLRPLDAAPAEKENLASTPPESPLAMPQQSLSRFDVEKRHRGVASHRDFSRSIARLLVFGGGLALTGYGAYQMYEVVAVGGVTILEWALLILFVANFSWIALACTSGLVGFLWLLFLAPKPPGLPAELHERTVVVMPIYNEDPARIFGAVQAIFENVQATGLGDAFDWWFLSDTTDPEIFVAEEQAFLAMRRRLDDRGHIFYRHRPKNLHRKAGNIQDFVTRWGGRYPQMVVLDADSLMTGHAIVTLAAAMEADPDAGIIQTLPLIVNRNTLFARIQQFAARIYGPVIAAGVSVWMGRDGNYWGHNAIIRTKAFAEYCGLPVLRGRPPFGGHILSHDFVEAALMLRAGYSVYMLPTLGGSFEESPPSLIDLSARDRRWCQGNLQHLRVLPARGLHLASRQHFITGIMAYMASPLWMLQLFVGIILVLQASYIRPEYFSSDFTLFPAWPRFDAERSLNLFALTMTILLLPKVFGFALALLQGETRRGAGGAIRLTLSTIFEIIMSALLAPSMMLIQSGHVMHFVFGFDTGWDPQRRDDGSIPFKAIIRRHRSHVAMGFLTLVAGLSIAPSLVAWMSPTILGLILAIFLSWATGLLAVGLALRKWGLLLTPEEQKRPPVVARANELAQELERLAAGNPGGLAAINSDPVFRAFHLACLPRAPKRRHGDISSEWALADAKLAEAESMKEALSWLQPKERMAILLDRKLIARLESLPAEPATVGAISSAR